MSKRRKVSDFFYASHQQETATSNSTATSAGNPASNNNSAIAIPSYEWQRCSEGFLKDNAPENDRQCSSDKKSCAGQLEKHKGFVTVSDERTNQRKHFGQRWIQSEGLFHPGSGVATKERGSQRMKAKSTSLCHTRQHQNPEDSDTGSISCDESDSETDTAITVRDKAQTPEAPKKGQRQKPTRRVQQKKQSSNLIAAKALRPEWYSGSESESCDAISAAESDEEQHIQQASPQTALLSKPTEDSLSPPKRRSPLLQIECAGSPEQPASPVYVHNARQHGLVKQGGKDQNFHSLCNPESEVENPSISSCASSQSAADTDVSPGTSGLRASQWAKQLKWDTTPTKQRPPSPPDPDSGKKKKKFVKGGLAERMSRILLREKSALRIWEHQHHKAEDLSQDSKSFTVRVKSLHCMYSLQLAECRVENASSPSSQPSANAECKLLFSPHSAHQPGFQPGHCIRIFPPWQQLDTSDGKVFLCKRYLVVSQASSVPVMKTRKSQDVDPNLDPLTSSPLATGHGRWMCPCSRDAGLAPSRCPAHLFPCRPGLLSQASIASPVSETANHGKALLTVTANESLPKRTLTFDTLLESMEKGGTGDKLLPTFQATVLRVFLEQGEDGCKRQVLLVEDSQGTVAVVSGADNVGHVEGRLCSFSCLRVCQRTNADRNPALFSVIAAAWSSRRKTVAASQEGVRLTHSDDSTSSSQVMQPPGFCYLLEVDRCVGEGGSQDDSLVVSNATLTGPPLPPFPCSTLDQALQTDDEHSRRVSLLAKVLCHIPKTQDSPSNSGEGGTSSKALDIFICDHSLQREIDKQSSSFRLKSRGIASEKDSVKLPSCVRRDSVKSGSSLESQGTTLEKDIVKCPGYVRVRVEADCVSDCLRCEGGRSKKCPYLLWLRDVWISDGRWVADRYTSLVVMGGEDRESVAVRSRLDAGLLARVKDCTVSLPTLTLVTSPHRLVSLSGVIQSVDEKSAFSWEECDRCASDRLATKTSSGLLVCLKCKTTVTSPVQRMKMEVLLCCDGNASITITISLLQSTIESLLPDVEDEEGYDVDCVLHKHVGPVNALITSTSKSDCTTAVCFTATELPT